MAQGNERIYGELGELMKRWEKRRERPLDVAYECACVLMTMIVVGAKEPLLTFESMVEHLRERLISYMAAEGRCARCGEKLSDHKTMH